MTKLAGQVRFLLGTCAMVLMLAIAAPAIAQQPSSVNPTASSVNEQQLLQQMRIINGRGTIPDVKSYNLEQPAGREWREFRTVILPWIGGVAILGMLLLLVVFYLWKGTVRLQAGRSGRTVVRFTAFERFVHWMTATCFIILGISGLNITFGRRLLLPLMSPQAFTDWSQYAKYAHNYLSFPFTIGVIMIALMWIAGNIPNANDVQWVKEGLGGILDRSKHPPAYRFNAGQKMMYWVVVLGGGAVAASGYVLMFPFYGTNVTSMQAAEIVHGTVAVLFVAAMLAHIYIGTLGMEGAFEAMGKGEVDLNWAKEHHALWLSEEGAATGPNEMRRQPAATPAE